jgi:hypothetical protein
MRRLLLPLVLLLWAFSAAWGEPVIISGSVPLLWLRRSDNLMGAEGVRRAQVESSLFSGVAATAAWGPVSVSAGFLHNISSRQVVTYLPPTTTAPYWSEWQAGYVTARIDAHLQAQITPDLALFFDTGIHYWANVIYSDEESGQTRASLPDTERAALDELFVTLGSGLEISWTDRWSWHVSVTGGYNLSGGEAAWQAMADANPELYYWPADVYISLLAGVRYSLPGPI